MVAVDQHYGRADLSASILAALQASGKNIDALIRNDLNNFDEFHFGSIVETRHLAQAADLSAGMHVAGMRVLDIGSGLGGPARTLAAEFGCTITGLDLTEEFVHSARELTLRTGLAGQVDFQQGDALDMPFPDSSFDVIWMQFAGMNIEDKSRLYQQFRRVLKDGGRFALHEVMAGSVSKLHYPVFWANDASLSFLRPPQEIRALLHAQGFGEVVWEDRTEQSLAWLVAERSQNRPPDPINPTLYIDNLQGKAANVIRNLEEKRMVVVLAVFELTKA